MAADGSIKIDTKIDSSSLPRQLKSMESAVKSSTSYMGDAFSRLRDVMQGPIAAAGMAKNALDILWGATIANAAAMEDFVAAFTPLTGSAENAKKMIAALNREAATTPFELSDIAKTAKQLLPVLGNDIEAVTKTFRMLGDTAGGSAEKLDSIARGYVKVMNTGKVSMEALNMISDAGVPIQNQLAESMGITVQEMYNLSSQGKITSEELTKTFQKMTSEGGLFFNGMTVASETLNGKMSTLSDNMKQAGAAIGNELLPVVKLLVDAANTVVGAFAAWAGKNDNLKKTFIAMVSALTGPMGSLLIPMIAKVRDAMGSWSIVFLSVKKVALSVVKSTLDYISNFANNFVTVINTMIGVYNKIVGVVGGKPIALFSKIDISTATGITDSVENITKEIEKEKRELANLAIQADKTSSTQKKGANESAEAYADTTESIKETNKAQEDGKRVDDERAKTGLNGAKNWANAIGRVAGALKNELGETLSGLIQDVANVGDNLISVVQTGGKDILAWAGLVAAAVPLLETMFKGSSFEAERAARQAQIMADAVKSAGATLSGILQSGGSSFEGYLGSKQASDYFDTVTAKYRQAASLMKSADDLLASRTAGDYVSGFVKIKEQMAAQMQQMGRDSLVAADNLKYVYDTVYSGNKVTANTSAVLSKWADELDDVVTAYGKTSKEVDAVNESYGKLLNDALYPTAAALRDANATLKTNSTLWTDAAKATYAFESSLSAIREKAASFYESFSNIGADISDTLVDSLVDGLDETSFLDAMKAYIMKMVVQAAVYTTELTDKIAKIGQRIATAIASGMTGDALAGIKNDLAGLFQEASGKASAVMGIVNSVFSGNAGVNSIANGLGGSLAPAVATTGGQTININLTSQNVTQLDGRTIAVSVAENIDTVLAAM